MHIFGKGNGTPLQYSCLENPMDGGAWWAAIYGVTQSWTRLKRLSSSMHIFKDTIRMPDKKGSAAAAKLLLSDSMRPHRWQPTRLFCPWDSPGKNTGVGGCHFLPQCTKVKSESEVAQLYQTPSDPWTAAHQAPPSMGFSRQEYWSGLPLPSPKKALPVYIVTTL